MSGIAVGHVLRTSHFSGTALLILIVIAEATHQDGTGAWPSVPSIARLARTTERSVYRLMTRLEKAGELKIDRKAGPRGTNLYAIPGIQQLRIEGADTVSPRRRKHLPLTTGPLTPDTAMSPEPSLSVRNRPSARLEKPRRGGLRSIGQVLNDAQRRAAR